MYSRRNEAFGKIHEFQLCESKQCKNVTVLSIATGPILNWSERLPISRNHDENYYRWQQMLNGHYIEMSIDAVSMICGSVCRVNKQ
jgi:hypothetical protein